MFVKHYFRRLIIPNTFYLSYPPFYKMSYTVAIVGRPNVGKSTLFNRLVGMKQAIVDDFSGVTRDRNYGVCEWNGRTFNIIDTGGFVLHSNDLFESAIRRQVEMAIEEANMILFMCDTVTGITDLDSDMATILRRTKKPVLVLVNKVDNSQRQLEATEFYGLGFEHTFFLSSMSGSGTGEILDLVASFVQEDVDDKWEGLPRIAIVGQPNVGKSSLVNALVGQERSVVTDIAGTTRDTNHTHYNMYNKEFVLIDTAGIRKKTKIHEDIEFYSVIRAIKALDESDVCVLMIDAKSGVEQQDLKIFSMIVEKKRGVVILVNKWDLIEKTTKTAKEVEDRIREKLAPFNDVPIIFTSATEKIRIFKAIESALSVFENKQQQFKTHELNTWLKESVDNYAPPTVKGKFVNIKFITQLPSRSLSFAIFSSNHTYIREAYRNYLEKRLRDRFNLTGIPINIFFREK